MTDVIKEVNQLDLFPATEDDFEYLIKYKYGNNNWHPIVLQNETYTCVWWNCEKIECHITAALDHYEITRNPNYKCNSG